MGFFSVSTRDDSCCMSDACLELACLGLFVSGNGRGLVVFRVLEVMDEAFPVDVASVVGIEAVEKLHDAGEMNGVLQGGCG